MPVTTLPMLDFLLGKPARKTPTKSYRFESWGAGYYRVASRGLGNTLGYVAKVDGAWEAEAQIDGPGCHTPPKATLPTREAAGQWCADNSNLRSIDR